MKSTRSKSPLKSSKDKAWDAFSRFIRLRDCLEWMEAHPEYNGELMGMCVTCCKQVTFKKGQAGHFVPGRTNAVLFDERGVNLQCYGCNIAKHGAYHEYWLWMEDNYGREVIDELLANRKVTIIYKAYEFEAIEEEYKQKYNQLLKNI